ncbi:MAG: cell division protein FtsX [Janthinobacterium lividum]
MPEAADRSGARPGRDSGHDPGGRSARAERRRRFDALGLRRARSDRLLPGLVAAMAFLAALALAGAVAASSLALRWREGAGAVLTVQVPDPLAPSVTGGVDRVDAVRALLGAQPGVASAHLLGEAELGELLRPWLGAGGTLSLPLPGVIEVRLRADAADGLAARLAQAAPGTLVERNGDWMRRLGALARSLQACAAAALVVVAGVAAAVVAVATRAGLSARRDAIGIVHGLGATDGFIAGRFAARATLLAGGGAAAGALAALPVLLGLASLAAPFAAPAGAEAAGGMEVLPATIWGALPVLPLLAAAIGWGTAQFTVRRWLRRLP